MNVELTEVGRRFGRTQAVAGVSLDAGPGVYGLLGPNGARARRQGRIVFRGTPHELTAHSQGRGTGDSSLECGYTAVLTEARA